MTIDTINISYNNGVTASVRAGDIDEVDKVVRAALTTLEVGERNKAYTLARDYELHRELVDNVAPKVIKLWEGLRAMGGGKFSDGAYTDSAIGFYDHTCTIEQSFSVKAPSDYVSGRSVVRLNTTYYQGRTKGDFYVDSVVVYTHTIPNVLMAYEQLRNGNYSCEAHFIIEAYNRAVDRLIDFIPKVEERFRKRAERLSTFFND